MGGNAFIRGGGGGGGHLSTLKVYGYTDMFSAIFIKGHNLVTSCLLYVDDIALLKWDLLLLFIPDRTVWGV